MSLRPSMGPYESFPDVLIRRKRTKEVALTSHSIRTYKVRSTDDRTWNNVRKLKCWPKECLPLNDTSEYDAIWVTLVEWGEAPINMFKKRALITVDLIIRVYLQNTCRYQIYSVPLRPNLFWMSGIICEIFGLLWFLDMHFILFCKIPRVERSWK